MQWKKTFLKPLLCFEYNTSHCITKTLPTFLKVWLTHNVYTYTYIHTQTRHTHILWHTNSHIHTQQQTHRQTHEGSKDPLLSWSQSATFVVIALAAIPSNVSATSLLQGYALNGIFTQKWTSSLFCSCQRMLDRAEQLPKMCHGRSSETAWSSRSHTAWLQKPGFLCATTGLWARGDKPPWSGPVCHRRH